jgi:hypothetical protein
MSTKRATFFAVLTVSLSALIVLIVNSYSNKPTFDVAAFKPSKDGYGWLIDKSLLCNTVLRLKLVNAAGESLTLATVNVTSGIHKIAVVIQCNKGKLNSGECKDLFIMISAFHIQRGDYVFHSFVCPRFDNGDRSFVVVTDKTNRIPIELLTTSGIPTGVHWESLVLHMSPDTSM